ncbi:MAG TPA: bifunctional methylenetetrahydrofolate dehydrogenase/methenyltetrahydrofolate cyclohydrolase FolD [Alphaproteobacteria bacterium]|nr:bifunctional methylenetetrahydrofolate dehydrogenase/methenyltetrahydrofolate cyclohydrolase FolD [Alphaproteobacteria bacterium]
MNRPVAIRIDGKVAALRLRAKVASEVAALKAAHGVVPGLAVVLIGDDPASQIYVRSKTRALAEAGMRSIDRRLPASVERAELMRVVDELNADPAVDGILVQLPLPRHLAADAVLDAIDPAKDVDGFHPINVGRLASGRDGVVPCTPLGCMMLIAGQRRDIAGLHAVVAGRSNIVGRPMAQLLLRADCTVTVAHSKTRELPALCRTADILVAAIGRPEIIRGDWVKPGAIVIDVGINRRIDADGTKHLIGDVHFAEAERIAGAITPVPGGVGPMTIACLLRNTLALARARRGLDRP